MVKDNKTYKQIGDWSVTLRTRNNHPGYKVWILQNDYEICSIDERGVRNRSNSSNIAIPQSVMETALEAWGSLLPAKNPAPAAKPYAFPLT